MGFSLSGAFEQNTTCDDYIVQLLARDIIVWGDREKSDFGIIKDMDSKTGGNVAASYGIFGQATILIDTYKTSYDKESLVEASISLAKNVRHEYGSEHLNDWILKSSIPLEKDIETTLGHNSNDTAIENNLAYDTLESLHTLNTIN